MENEKKSRVRKKAPAPDPKKRRYQVALIESICAETGLSYDRLAELALVRPATMYKLRKGYQEASEGTLELIRTAPQRLSVQATDAAPARASGRRQAAHEEPPSDGSKGKADGRAVARRDGNAADEVRPAPTLAERLSYILEHAGFDETVLVRGFVDLAYRQLERRQHQRRAEPPKPDRVLRLPHHHQLVPLLGAIPASAPQDAIQQTEEYVAVPKRQAVNVEYALRVHGESMSGKGIHDGDIVLLTTKREPRTGTIVAALFDETEVTLKTYVDRVNEVYLRPENPDFPPRMVPKNLLQVQGVVVGKLT